MLLLKSPRLRLTAIYAGGNAWANPGPTSRAFYDILHMHGVTDVPIFIGSHHALADERAAEGTGSLPKLRYRDTIPAGRRGMLYSDTLWGTAHLLPTSFKAYSVLEGLDTDEASIPVLVAHMAAFPSATPIAWLATGTLSVMAKLFAPPHADALAPLLPRITGLIIMGGAVGVSGNLFSLPANSVSEFNIYNDPLGAAEGLTAVAASGITVTMVPLDATNDAPITPALLTTLLDSPTTPEAQYMGVLLELRRRTAVPGLT